MPMHKAIIPAAGFGTRMLPATKSIPKELVTVVDKPAIAYVVEEAVAAGFRLRACGGMCARFCGERELFCAVAR